MRRSGYNIHAISLTGLDEISAAGGWQLAPQMQAVGLDHQLLRQPEAQMPFEQYCRLLDICAQAWSMPDLGLRMVPYQHLEVLGAVALVTRMETTLRAALKALSANLVIHSNALIAMLDEASGDTVASIVLEILPVQAPVRQYAELALGVTRNVLEQVAGVRIDLIEVTFEHQAAGSERTARACFRCPVHYGAGRTAFHFPAKLLDTPLERSDIAYHAIVRRFLKSEKSLAETSVVSAARREVSRQMEVGSCTVESLAAGLSMSKRSLQRSLAGHGVSFRRLADDWRRQRAMLLLSQTRLPLAEISVVLGYAEQSVFTSAFRRWYGVSPLRYRKREFQPDSAAAGDRQP